MANRTFQRDTLSLIKRIVTLYPVVKVTDGAGTVQLQKRQFTAMGSGSVAPGYSLVAAPTSGVGYAVGDGQGTRSVTRTAQGKWTITLSDPYLYLIQATVAFSNSGASFNAPIVVVDTAGNVQTNTAPGNGGTVKVVFYNGSGTATDPGNGDIANFCIVLGDSEAP